MDDDSDDYAEGEDDPHDWIAEDDDDWTVEKDEDDDESTMKANLRTISTPEIYSPPALQGKSKYIQDNKDLYYALCEVDDWGFSLFADEQQEEYMKSLIVEVFQPGENVIVEGSSGNDLYIIVASESTVHSAEVEVVNGNLLAGTEVFLTKLRRGQYFGQKYFVTRRSIKRAATCRVPKNSTVPVAVAKLTPENFDKWEPFRNLLLVRTVPLIQMLPRAERMKILQVAHIHAYKDGDYIITQGEQGEEFFIIQEGAVKVVERKMAEGKKGPPRFVTLVTLREGHCFGEMSLVTNQPRVASVIAIRTTICLCISKSDFESGMSSESFGAVVAEIARKNMEIRERKKSLSSSSSQSSMVKKKKRVQDLIIHEKFERNGNAINGFVQERVLGKGSFGEVFLCCEQETNVRYAMKVVARPKSSWSDQAGIIKQEMEVMKMLYHPNIVCGHAIIDDPTQLKIYLISELVDGGELMPESVKCEPIDERKAWGYFRDILKGVSYLHSEGIVHRDIKPQNILLTKGGVAKIADFGSSVFINENQGKPSRKLLNCTPFFTAPEIYQPLEGMDYSRSPGIDVFALGATLYFMIFGQPPWNAEDGAALASKITNIELTFPTNQPPHLKHLCKMMLMKDPRVRCTLDACVVDDWVTEEGSEPLFNEDELFASQHTESVEEEDENEGVENENMKDFQNFKTIKSRRNLIVEESRPPPKIPPARKSLSRKAAFGQAQVVDKPLKPIFNDANRKAKREEALKKSKMAQEYRRAKLDGDVEKMKMLKIQSRRNLTKNFNSNLSLASNGSNSSNPEIAASVRGSLGGPPHGSPSTSHHHGIAMDSSSNSHSQSSKKEHNVSLNNIDKFINNHVETIVEELEGDDESISKQSNTESVCSEVHDDDEDYGLSADDVIVTMNMDASIDDMFSDLIVDKKPVDAAAEAKEWNHVIEAPLTYPLVTREESWSPQLGLRFSKSESIVSRSYMEDRCCVRIEESPEEGRAAFGFFGVFDGHGGDAVAILLQQTYVSTFTKFFREIEGRIVNQKANSVASFASKISQVYDKTSAHIDMGILEKDYEKQQKILKTGGGIQECNYAGSVAVVMTVFPLSMGKAGTEQVCCISHVGDCRAVLSKGGSAEQLTEDHKASNKAEIARIEAAGGFVANNRVNAGLGVARSFGDIQFKEFNGDIRNPVDFPNDPNSLWGSKQHVISKPAFTHFVVEKSHEFVIMASDGLWDVFSCQEAVNFVRNQLSVNPDLLRAADELIQRAIIRGTQDNTTVVICAFHQFS